MANQLKKGRQYLKNGYWALVGALAAMIISLQPVMADTIWDRFSAIMRDVYGQLAGISTIVAVTAAAVALLVRMISRNQRAVDEATSWIKRIVVAELAWFYRGIPSAACFRRTVHRVILRFQLKGKRIGGDALF